MLAPFSAQVGLEPSSKHHVFPWFLAQIDPKMGPRSTQDRSKMGPRSSWVAFFFRLEFSLRFLIVLGSILVPFWPPKWSRGGAASLRKSALGGSKTVPRSSWFGPFFVLSFGIAFLVVLGSFWGAPGVVLVLFRHFNSSIQPINSSIHRFNTSTHQLIDSSTHGPSALPYPALRTARCAIK